MKFTDLNPEQQQKLLNKLSKLKALSQCPTGNVNETATAAAAMTRLMLEYQLEMAEFGLEETHTGVEQLEVFEAAKERGIPTWQVGLLGGLAEAHHCASFSEAKVVGFYLGSFRRAKERRYYLVGAHQDVEQVKRLFHYCVTEIERLCYEWHPRARVAAKNDFRLGASRGIVHQVQAELQAIIREESRRDEGHSAGLVLFESKLRAVADYFQQHDIRTRTLNVRRPGASAYQDGYMAGSSLDLKGRSRPGLGSGTTPG